MNHIWLVLYYEDILFLGKNLEIPALVPARQQTTFILCIWSGCVFDTKGPNPLWNPLLPEVLPDFLKFGLTKCFPPKVWISSIIWYLFQMRTYESDWSVLKYHTWGHPINLITFQFQTWVRKATHQSNWIWESFPDLKGQRKQKIVNTIKIFWKFDCKFRIYLAQLCLASNWNRISSREVNS